jgi:hypothetical protein
MSRVRRPSEPERRLETTRHVMDTLRRERLVDELVEAYVDWRETCARVADAYRSWANETARGDRVAFALYTAALDAEEQAAKAYAELVRRAGNMPWSEDPASEPLGGPRCGADRP